MAKRKKKPPSDHSFKKIKTTSQNLNSWSHEARVTQLVTFQQTCDPSVAFYDQKWMESGVAVTEYMKTLGWYGWQMAFQKGEKK